MSSLSTIHWLIAAGMLVALPALMLGLRGVLGGRLVRQAGHRPHRKAERRSSPARGRRQPSQQADQPR